MGVAKMSSSESDTEDLSDMDRPETDIRSETEVDSVNERSPSMSEFWTTPITLQ